MTHRYTVRSVERKDDILLLTLIPKQQGRRLNFQAGQYAAIGFTRRGRPTPMRCFSIVSSPSDDALQFAMRVRGNFTQVAATLAAGDDVYVQGPFGDFTIDPVYDQRVVMLAGGIGITPFLSMIRDLTERHIALPITLLFSNRSAHSIPFMDQLQTLARQNPYLHVQFFGDGASGRVTERHVRP
jgi:ferredoxin-NADP reductase